MQKATQLKMSFSELIIKYVRSNMIMTGVALYLFIALFLKIEFSIDILVPCLWKTIFHFNCPGCGLTHALIKLIAFDFYGAFKVNPLIFIVLPAGVFYIVLDFVTFRKKMLIQ